MILWNEQLYCIIKCICVLKNENNPPDWPSASTFALLTELTPARLIDRAHARPLETHAHIQTDRHKNKLTYRRTARQTAWQKDRKTEIPIDWHTDRQTIYNGTHTRFTTNIQCLIEVIVLEYNRYNNHQIFKQKWN